MPFSKDEDQQQFDSLIELIKQNMSTDIEFYKEQRGLDGNPIKPKEWQDTQNGTPLLVGRKVSQPFNDFGPDIFYYTWKNPKIVGRILRPAFDETDHVGLNITIPQDTSSEDLELLFAAIEQNDAFAARIVEMDFANCNKLAKRVIFPKNLSRLQNLNMERISTTFVRENYDDLGPVVLFDTAKMGAPDLSVMPNLRKVNFTHTNFTQWPILPKSLVDYVQYGSEPMSITRLNLSSKALPNLQRAYFDGSCTQLTDAYAICLARMMRARPEVKLDFSSTWYSKIKGYSICGTEDLGSYELTHDLLDEHFNKIVQDSTYANRELVTETELRQCASNLYDMLLDAQHVKSQAIVASYIDNRLPAVIAQVKVKRAQRAEREMTQGEFGQAPSRHKLNHI